MTMCPRCFELYSEIWSKPCCKCADKTIPVDIELINVVQMLLARGFEVSYATCYPDKEQGEIEAMEIEIHFRKLYPQALFYGLPPDFNETCSGYVVTALQDIKCNEEQIKNILYALIRAFDRFTLEEARKAWQEHSII